MRGRRAGSAGGRTIGSDGSARTLLDAQLELCQGERLTIGRTDLYLHRLARVTPRHRAVLDAKALGGHGGLVAGDADRAEGLQQGPPIVCEAVLLLVKHACAYKTRQDLALKDPLVRAPGGEGDPDGAVGEDLVHLHVVQVGDGGALLGRRQREQHDVSRDVVELILLAEHHGASRGGGKGRQRRGQRRLWWRRRI